MIMQKKMKIDFYFVIGGILIILAILCFILPFTNFNEINLSRAKTTNFSLADFAGYIKFLFKPNKASVTFSLFAHNFSLALIIYILGLFTAGIFDILPICSAFYVAGATIYSSHNMSTIIFVCLELFGVILSVFFGIHFHKKRLKFEMPLKIICINSIILIISLIGIYMLAAFIESGLISSMWGAN